MGSLEIVVVRMAKKSSRPKLFKNSSAPKSAMQRVGNALIQKTLDAGTEAAQKSAPKDSTIQRKPKYLEVTEKRMSKLGVIDLKPFFAQSSKRKAKEGGGWYLRVPIRLKARKMSSRMYKQLNAIDISPDEQRTVISDYLYDRRRVSDSNMLNYKPKSYNVTKKRVGNNRHSYVAFRTVSSDSPASSWIINRDRVNSSDTSKTFVSNVNRLMKWKMKNGWD
jgi:hypothetical protein